MKRRQENLKAAVQRSRPTWMNLVRNGYQTTQIILMNFLHVSLQKMKRMILLLMSRGVPLGGEKEMAHILNRELVVYNVMSELRIICVMRVNFFFFPQCSDGSAGYFWFRL